MTIVRYFCQVKILVWSSIEEAQYNEAETLQISKLRGVNHDIFLASSKENNSVLSDSG